MITQIVYQSLLLVMLTGPLASELVLEGRLGQEWFSPFLVAIVLDDDCDGDDESHLKLTVTGCTLHIVPPSCLSLVAAFCPGRTSLTRECSSARGPPYC
jgi:hypothetical protein